MNRQRDPGKQTSGVPDPANIIEKEERLKHAIASVQEGMLNEGIDALRELVRAYPAYAEAWGHLGHCLSMMERFEEAIPCYEKILKAHPDNMEAYRCLGNCNYALGRRRRARTAYLKLQGTPLYDASEVQERVCRLESIPRRVFRKGPGILWTLRIRALDGRFRTALAAELMGIGKSIQGIRAAGFSQYLSYLANHYFRGTFYNLLCMTCDLCGSADFRAVFFFEEQKKVECRNCGLEFVERRPLDSRDVAEDIYAQKSTIEFYKTRWGKGDLVDSRMSKLSSMFEESGIRFPEAGMKVFEVGCSVGALLKYLAGQGLEVEGIETSNELVEHCRSHLGLNVNRGTVRTMIVPDGCYDLVMAYHVLEHLDKPSQMFDKADKMLRKGGHLLIEVPVPDLSNLSFEKQMNLKYGYANKSHLYYFRKNTVIRYFEKHGFKMVSVQTHMDTEVDLPCAAFLGRKE